MLEEPKGEGQGGGAGAVVAAVRDGLAREGRQLSAQGELGLERGWADNPILQSRRLAGKEERAEGPRMGWLLVSRYWRRTNATRTSDGEGTRP